MGQKIVGFSFYGDLNTDHSRSKGYFEGIRGNLELMPKYYPGWIMRIYFDLDPKHPVLQDLCDLACNNEQLDICHAGKLPGTPMKDARKVFAMNWRFFPTLDPQVRQTDNTVPFLPAFAFAANCPIKAAINSPHSTVYYYFKVAIVCVSVCVYTC